MNNCLFCQIIKRELEAKIQYENNDIIAFDDIRPRAPIHILILPKKHLVSADTLTEKDAEILIKMILAAQHLARKNNLSGYKLLFNVGRAGGQIVDHLHLHLLAGQKQLNNI